MAEETVGLTQGAGGVVHWAGGVAQEPEVLTQGAGRLAQIPVGLTQGAGGQTLGDGGVAQGA